MKSEFEKLNEVVSGLADLTARLQALLMELKLSISIAGHTKLISMPTHTPNLKLVEVPDERN